MQAEVNVLIIGAGMAGMTAALDLARSGLHVAIVEARDRVGGRVFTKRDPVTNAAIELGAEFVHGRPPEILRLLAKINTEVVETAGVDWCEKDGGLSPCDLFSDVDGIFDRMTAAGEDESFADFLQRHCADISNESKERARAYVTGFHAADPARISTHSLVKGMRADEKIDGETAFRIPGGYEVLVKLLRRDLELAGVPVHLNTVVQMVRWTDKDVSIECHTDEGHQTYSAPIGLITVPLGVLQARANERGAIQFSPDLPEVKKQALSGLAMGKVMRVTMRFRERFWEKLKPNGSDTLADLRFLFSQQNWFPTWWTMMPVKVPIITGWAPFHCAEELSGQDASMIFSSACETLRSLFRMREQAIEDLVESAAFHDWQTDPFSRGAYSYVQVGGDSAQSDLGAPIDNRLFFAGEATDVSGHPGTVHGAIASGHRAAEDILRQSGRI